MSLPRESNERTERPSNKAETGNQQRMAVDNQVGKDIHNMRGNNSTMPESLKNNVQIAGLPTEGRTGNGKPAAAAGENSSTSSGGGRKGSDAQRSATNDRQPPPPDGHTPNEAHALGHAKPEKYKSEVRTPGAKQGDYTLKRTTQDNRQIVDTHTGNTDGGSTDTHTEDGRTSTLIRDKKGELTYSKNYNQDGKGGFREYKKDQDGSETSRYRQPNGDYKEISNKGGNPVETDRKAKPGGGFSESKHYYRTGLRTSHEEDGKGNYKDTVTKNGKTTSRERSPREGGAYTEKVSDENGKVTTTDHQPSPDGSYTDTISNEKGEITSLEHTPKANGDFSEKITDTKGQVSTKEHTQGKNGAYQETTTKPDGSQIRFDRREDGSYTELDNGKDGSLKTHSVRPEGGFIDRTSDKNGSTIHDEAANGDYSERSYDNTGSLKSPPIEVKGASHEFADRAKADIDKLPEGDRKQLAKEGYKYVITDTLTHEDPNLANQTPDGHLPGTTWDNLDGYQDSNAKKIVVAEKAKDNVSNRMESSNRVEGVANHETGHAVDSVMGRQMGDGRPYSQSKDFDDAYQKDYAKLTADDKKKEELRYTTQQDKDGNATARGKSETFAEIYGALNGSSTNTSQTQEMLDKYPNVANLLRGKLSDFGGSR